MHSNGGNNTAAQEWIVRFFGAKSTALPFSFTYNGQPSSVVLSSWTREYSSKRLDEKRMEHILTYRDKSTGLIAHCRAVEYKDFPAVEWLLTFENTGSVDTPIIEDIQAMDIAFSSMSSFILHKTMGAPSNPTDFQPSTIEISKQHSEALGGVNGRSSNVDLPFFKVEMGDTSVITAVGWSGQWKASFNCSDDQTMRQRAGLELTHFLLHPKESVRMPRILVMYWKGDTLKSNAQFRQLIYGHYAAKRSAKTPDPTLFSNTCFTRGGGWLNETTEQNQISLINAYAPLGLQGVVTDAGWFKNGWPNTGDWTPREDNYPNGMAPVAAAALKKGMIYGLWFEPERVMAGTTTHKEHPDWCIGDPNYGTLLLNFGLPEVQDYFFNIVKGYMELPGFRFYRQDFNMDPLSWWRSADTPDRQGITEIKYITGLYAYWDRIASTWPDSFREECASGGRRIDLETVMRMHAHQDSDYWFDCETDQNQNWGISQYLPNNTIVQHLISLDAYSLHSTMASSLCIGWIADDPAFDSAAAKRLTDRYLALRHLFIGAWYPLLPYSQKGTDSWMASQYHRDDLDEGVAIAIRRPESSVASMKLKLHSLKPDGLYEVSFDVAGGKRQIRGKELMNGIEVTMPKPRDSELVHYITASEK